MTQKTISYFGKPLSYQLEGDGQPVVLLHGFAEDSDVWREQIRVLSENYRLIIPDLPGSGKSALQDNMSMAGLAAAVHAVLEDACAGKQVVMIGHSMGGYVTLAFAADYPQLLKGFGLFHSTAFADSEEKKATRRRGIGFMQTHGSYEFVKQSAPNLFTEDFRMKNAAVVDGLIERYGAMDKSALIAYYESMIARPDRQQLIISFAKPILFIIGRHDKAIPFEDSMKQCHLPQISTVHILNASAHMGMWEEPEKSNRALITFLEYAHQQGSFGTSA